MYHLVNCGITIDEHDEKYFREHRPKTLIAHAGEMDVRIHLGADPSKIRLEWITTYIGKIIEFAELYSIGRVIIATPIRPVSSTCRSIGFNANGSDKMRVEASKRIEDLVAKAIHDLGEPRLTFLLTSSLQMRSSDVLDAEDTSDGVHASLSYARRVCPEVKSMTRI